MGKRPLLRALDSGHYEVASDEGAENWAMRASLIETCKLHAVNPQAYLTDVLTKLVDKAVLYWRPRADWRMAEPRRDVEA
jgi:hypothetical protein